MLSDCPADEIGNHLILVIVPVSNFRHSVNSKGIANSTKLVLP